MGTFVMILAAPILVAVGLIALNRARARQGKPHGFTGWSSGDGAFSDAGFDGGGDCGGDGGGDGGGGDGGGCD